MPSIVKIISLVLCAVSLVGLIIDLSFRARTDLTTNIDAAYSISTIVIRNVGVITDPYIKYCTFPGF